MATYNGEKYIEKQLLTILSQIRENDEVIISDDSSKDNTIAIIESFKDNRIRLYKNNVFYSPVYNFEFALSNAVNDIILLADQDDEWLPERVNKIIDIFKSQQDVSLIVNKCNIIDAKGNIIRKSFFKDLNPVNHSFLWNLARNPYLGCCMSFRKNVLHLALPFPKNTPMHDIWIGLLAQFNGKCIYCDDSLVNYRRHESNTTKGVSPYPLWYRVYYRILLLCRILYRSWSKK
jgi:glycosyltransferase involved in cell wall biosynthesis